MLYNKIESMVWLNKQSFAQIAPTIKQIGYAATAGYLIGFIYGKMNHLPARKIAIIASTWQIAESALLNLVDYYNPDRNSRKLHGASIIILSSILGAHQFQKYHMIGKKMMMMVFLFKGAVVYGILKDVPELKLSAAYSNYLQFIWKKKEFSLD